MLTFGFSAFLKLLCLTDRRQRSEIGTRLVGRGGGYDFHRSLRLLCRRYSNNQISLSEGLGLAEGITRIPERRSAKAGFQAFADWNEGERNGSIYPTVSYTSPTERFRVTFAPDISRRIAGRQTAIHIWNTASPPLDARSVHMALHLAADAYIDASAAPQDIAVLDLRTSQVYKLAEAEVTLDIAHALADRLDALLAQIEAEINQREERPFERPGPQVDRQNIEML